MTNVADPVATVGLRHYSPQPVDFDPTRRYEQLVSYKPKGLWVSVGSAWKDWVDGEQLGWLDHASVYDLDLDQSDILLITSTAELANLTARFGRETPWGSRGIDWPLLAEAHAGIIITPHLWTWELPHDFFWYYGWDCASGCIWDLSVVRSFRQMARDLAVAAPKGRA